MNKVTDIIVEVGNPRALDATLNQLGAFVCQNSDGSYEWLDGGYKVRCFNDVGFIKFAITNQGYGRVIKELEELI